MNPIQLLASGVIPILVALLSSPKWPGGVRASLAFALCVGLALWQAHGQFGTDVLENVLKVFALVQGLYLGLLKHIGLPALERGSAEAWTKFICGLSQGFSSGSAGFSSGSAKSTKDRVLELKALLEAGAITTETFEARAKTLLEEI